ncbi:MAG TPA: CRTAC1 family protein [Rhodanobacteraceae bacterium]|nr:CRTAC1 family protein [Rhodanobacteraceae bacterium]
MPRPAPRSAPATFIFLPLLLAASAGQARSGDSHAFQFVDETAQRLQPAAASSYRFDAMWTDFNADGCYDAWIFDHDNPATSRLWLNRCDGSHRLQLAGNDQVHYYIAEPVLPRGSGWVTLLDVNGDGRQDFWTRDASTLAAAYLNATPPGQHLPLFGSKMAACDEHCILADVNGDDRFDIVHEDRSVEDALDHRHLADAAAPSGWRTPVDLDGDGWVDLLQAGAGGYWHNNHGALTWRAVAGLTGSNDLVAAADFDNDGDIDFVTLNQGSHGTLYRNDGNGTFHDASAGSGIDQLGYTDWWSGYGNLIAADFDNDGYPDLLVAGADYSPSVILLRNLGNLTFERVGLDLGDAASGSESAKARASVADFDNDGRLDILKTQTGSNAGLWRNVTDTAGRHWMKVRVRGQGANSDGVGADLEWYAAGTTQRLAHMQVQVSNDHPQTWLHTGLGEHAQVDLVVRWPHGGPVQRFTQLAADQEVIAWPGGCLLQHWQPGHGWPLATPAHCGEASQCVPTASPLPRSIPPVRNARVGEAKARAAASAAGQAPPTSADESGCPP